MWFHFFAGILIGLNIGAAIGWLLCLKYKGNFADWIKYLKGDK